MTFRETENDRTVDLEEEKEMREEMFLKDLHQFMKKRDSPIERIPHLGFKQIDLFLMYKTVTKLGGYHKVTSQQLWKQVYNTLGGNPRSTSAATCTRRHYEKLILPYECHVEGMDYTEVLPPRPNKRSHYNSLSEDDECPRTKMSHTALLQQAYPTDSTLRVKPYSTSNCRPYFPPSHLSLPPYVPLLPPNVSFSVPQTDPQAPWPSPRGCSTERVKQPLEHLRYLADKYNRGISQTVTEPLDLRCKDLSPDSCNNPASSFTPTSSMKPPKFLNQALPLYQAKVLAREEGCERPKTEAGKSSPVYFTYPPVSKDGYVIDLTSSRSSQSPSHASTPPTHSEIPTPQIRERPCNPSMDHPLKCLKTQVCPDMLTQVKEENPKPSSGPLNLSCSQPSTPRQSGGRMEIQIPLALLHDWIKEGLLCGPSSSGVGSLSSTGPTSSHTPGPKHRDWGQARPDIPSSRSDPTNLPFRHPYAAQQMANRSPRERSIDRDRNMPSQSTTHNDLPPSPTYSPQSYKPIPFQGTWDVRNQDVYRWEEQEARRPYHVNNMQFQNPQDRNPRETQSKSRSSPCSVEQDDLAPRSLVSSASLGTLTPEEIMKLKRLIYSS